MTRRSRSLEPAAWWSVRRAQSLRPATYRCPLCGDRLHAMSPHVLIAPEGDTSRRRHAHAGCVAAAELTTYAEWRQSQPRPGLLARAATLFRPRRP
jgi:hypothetical protein